MTNHEAIKILKVQMHVSADMQNDLRTEALQMAIKTLEQQDVTDTDTISRRQAINALFEILDRPKHADFLYADEIARALNQLPPSPSIKSDTDTISRQDAIEHLKKRLYESALNNDGIASKIFEEIADNRVQIWVEELPPSPYRP